MRQTRQERPFLNPVGCTRPPVSHILSGSSKPREEWDIESCAPIFQRPIISDYYSHSGCVRDVIFRPDRLLIALQKRVDPFAPMSFFPA